MFRGLAVTQFGHVERVRDTSRNHQQRLVDKIHSFARVECHKIYQTAFGVLECRIGVRVALQVILVSVTVKVEGEFCGLFRCHSAHVADIFGFPFPLLSDVRHRHRQELLNFVYLRIEKTITAHQSRVEHTQRGYRLKRLSVCAAFNV